MSKNISIEFFRILIYGSSGLITPAHFLDFPLWENIGKSRQNKLSIKVWFQNTTETGALATTSRADKTGTPPSPTEVPTSFVPFSRGVEFCRLYFGYYLMYGKILGCKFDIQSWRISLKGNKNLKEYNPLINCFYRS